MFSPEKRLPFATRIREGLQKNNTITCALYGLSALVADGANGAIALHNPAANELLLGYGHDTLFPVQCYFALRATWLGTIHRDKFNWLGSMGGAAAVFASASTFEVFQKFGIYQGTYDSGDFIAYGLGVGLAITLDALTFRKIDKSSSEIIR